MRLSNSIIKEDSLSCEVFQFVPTVLNSKDPETVAESISVGEMNGNFKVADVMKDFTGLSTLESERLERHIEDKTLEKLKELQEAAYKEAYNLGMDEGRKEAIHNYEKEIAEKLSEFDVLISSIESLKPQLINFNEAHILKLIYFLSTKLAMFEIASHEEAIINVLKETIKMTQSDEKVTVNVSDQDFRFIENFKKELHRDFEFLKRIELKAQDNIRSGGCIITTNYGEIDSTVEARIDQMWKSLEESMPKVKNQIGA